MANTSATAETIRPDANPSLACSWILRLAHRIAIEDFSLYLVSAIFVLLHCLGFVLRSVKRRSPEATAPLLPTLRCSFDLLLDGDNSAIRRSYWPPPLRNSLCHGLLLRS